MDGVTLLRWALLPPTGWIQIARLGVTWLITHRTAIGSRIQHHSSRFLHYREVLERGSYGNQLYRIRDASLLNRGCPLGGVTNDDTNLTGYESNFLPGFVRDPYGDLSRRAAIQM